MHQSFTFSVLDSELWVLAAVGVAFATVAQDHPDSVMPSPGGFMPSPGLWVHTNKNTYKLLDITEMSVPAWNNLAMEFHEWDLWSGIGNRALLRIYLKSVFQGTPSPH